MPITFIGWVGILLGFAAMALVSRRERGVKRVALVFTLALVQTAVGIYFYIWAQSNISDAYTYYYDPYGFYTRGFGLSTQFVIWLVQSLKEMFGGTYLDFFLLFQASGTWGAVILLKTMEDVFGDARVAMPSLFFLLLFLPGLHFWTAFIGKDGALFLGAALTARAAFDIQKRWLLFGAGVLLMILFRPYIAMLAVASIAAAIMLDKKTAPLTKIFLSIFAVAGLALAAASTRSTFQVDVTSAESVSDFFATQTKVMQVESQEGGSGAQGPYPVRVLSLLFRPFFFDAGGIPGLIASFENLVLLFIFGFMAYHVRILRELFRRVMLIRYCVIFTIAVILLLATVYYNVGLGLRQKMMAMPTLLTLLAGIVAVLRLQVRNRRLQAQPA